MRILNPAVREARPAAAILTSSLGEKRHLNQDRMIERFMLSDRINARVMGQALGASRADIAGAILGALQGLRREPLSKNGSACPPYQRTWTVSFTQT